MSKRPRRWRPVASPVVRLVGAYALGSVPVAGVVARRAAGVDLRGVGSGTVSATNVYRVAGTAPFLAVAALDVAKGIAAAACVRGRPGRAALGAALVVAGHNWSPLLRGAGGRGVLPAFGVLLVAAPPGAALLAGGVLAGYLAGDTAPGCLAAQVLMVPVLAATAGRRGALIGAAVALPMLAKRLLGNGPPRRGNRQRHGPGRAYLTRLVFDRDVR